MVNTNEVQYFRTKICLFRCPNCASR